MIDTNANSFLKLLDTERLHSFPKLSRSQTNSLQHQMSSWTTSPECQLGFSSQERTSVKLETVLSFWEAHCFKAAQQHKMRKQENLAAIAFSQFPSPWSPDPSQARGSQTGELTPVQTHHSTATSEQTHEHQPRGTAVAPLWARLRPQR